MSSVPTSSHLSASPTPGPGSHRIHRHRRSAAISGDFDVIGLGLFSPPPPISKTSRHTSISSSSQNLLSHSTSHQRLFLSSYLSQAKTAVEDSDKRFQRSSDDDFTNKPQQDPFHFPVKSPEMFLLSLPSTPKYMASPIRKYGDVSLNSPIRLKNTKNASSINCPSTPKLFLTEETTLNNENIPDPVIDLDEILNANTANGDNAVHDCEFGLRNQDDFLASPFTKLGLSAFSLQTYSSPSYMKQPIREQAADAIVEEDDLDEFQLAEEEILEERSEGTTVLDENDIDVGSDVFANPQDTFSGLYLTLSANSSNSSLPSTGGNRMLFPSVIEKTSSNSSKDSGVSTFFSFNGTPTSKRSSAMATRYQSFYDQSYKISSALKYSSTESIPIVSSQGSENVNGVIATSGKENNTTGSKILGHSSSLPSLKSNIMRPTPVRYNDFRTKRDVKAGKVCLQINKTPAFREHLSRSPNSSLQITTNAVTLSPSKKLQSKVIDLHSGLSKQKKNIHAPPSSKVSNSPSSLVSEYSSTVTSAGEASTDHSSVMSQGDVLVSSLKTSASEMSRSSTPIIVVSTECESLTLPKPPANEHFNSGSSFESIRQENDGFRQENGSRRSSRRAMSPGEKKILASTEIPPLRKQGKTKSVSRTATTIDYVGSRSETTQATIGDVHPTDDGSSTLKKQGRRKSDRFSSWFRRHK